MHRKMSVRVIAIFIDIHKKLCLVFDDKNIAMCSCVCACVCVSRGGGYRSESHQVLKRQRVKSEKSCSPSGCQS